MVKTNIDPAEKPGNSTRFKLSSNKSFAESIFSTLLCE